MKPILKLLADGEVRQRKTIISWLADHLDLSPEDRAIRLPSGVLMIDNRGGWAISDLKAAGLISRSARSMYQITDEGRKVLSENHDKITKAILLRYPSYRETIKSPDIVVDKGPVISPPETTTTPEETIELSSSQLQARLASEILDTVKKYSPHFFERLVVDLLLAMGYGGSLAEAGQAIGRSGDGGIDGIIKEDKLGLDYVAIQAKRWEGTVGRPEVQAFVGSMEGMKAKKGVLITTGNFTKDAIEYVRYIHTKIVLINGSQLAGLLIDHNVGVTPARTFVIKKLDQDYFEDDGI